MIRALRPLTFPGDGTALVPLTRGKVAVIDAADAHLVDGRLWSAMKGRGACWYAVASDSTLMHRVIVAAALGVEVDHGDGDGLNNRRGNLTEAGRMANSRNLGKRANSPFGVIGVSRHSKTGRYIARIMVGGRNLHLGYFATLDDAKAARVAAEVERFGILPRRREELAPWLG